MVSAIERQLLQSKIIERIQQVQQQHPDLQQQYFEVQLSQERRRMMKKINESDQIYHPMIDDKEERKHQQDPSKRQKTEEPDGKEDIKSEQEPHCHIDIKV
jgi:hypothetical protein